MGFYIERSLFLRTMKRKIVALLLSFSLCFSGLFGCGKDTKSLNTSPYDEFITVDVFDQMANMQGIQSGWFAKVVKDKFNMELNIIAPNVAGGGNTLFESMAAAGDLGDLVICTAKGGNLQNMVNSHLLYNMEDLIKDKDVMKYEYAIGLLNDSITPEGIYAIPSEISTLEPTQISSGQELTFGPYLRWDIYKKIGYPTMETLEDLLTVLKNMQTAYPFTETGNKTYGFSLFSNWDDNMMNAIKQPCTFYGYDEIGFVLARADGTDYQNILDRDSIYMRVLEFYFNANQMGLVDPDSLTQDYSDIEAKFKSGQILFSPWPWQAQPVYNTVEHTAAGKGYMMAPINDMEVFAYGCIPGGNQQNVIAIGANAKDPERMADFIDWLYSPEGIFINGASGGAAGPEGLTWTMENGVPVLTELGYYALIDGDVEIPEEWGGSTWKNGISALNYKAVNVTDYSPDGFPYSFELWASVLKEKETALSKDWSEHLGANTTVEYMIENNQIVVAPGASYVSPQETSEIVTIRNQCKKNIIDYSWQMVFAKDKETFDALYDELISVTNTLGYEQVLAIDMENAKNQDIARKATLGS